MFKTVFHFRVQSGTSRQGDSRERLASAVRQSLQENLIILDYAYPKIKIDLLFVESDEFSPELVAKLSADTGILPSFMFIRCPGKSFKCNIGEFDGLRTIMRWFEGGGGARGGAVIASFKRVQVAIQLPYLMSTQSPRMFDLGKDHLHQTAKIGILA
jgi:hypothetical protein